MTLRLPLLGKILGWLTLNLLFLVVAIGLLFMVEFPVDSLLLELMGDRPQRAADLLMAELRTRSHVDRLESLVRFSEVYGVEAILVRDDGLLANDLKRWVPEEVLKKVSNNPRRPSPDFSERPEERPGEDRPPRGLREGPPRGGFDQHPGRPPRLPIFGARAFVRAGTPVRYWFVVGGVLESTKGLPPLHLILVSDRISGGGFFFDFWPWIWWTTGVLVLSVLWWIPFVRSISRFISQMTQVTERIAEGDFDSRVIDDRGDELGRLGVAINRMTVRLDGFVGGQKRFLGDIAHELCSPLARMEVALGILDQRCGVGLTEYVGDVSEEVRHMSGLVNELLQFTKAGLKAKDLPLQLVLLETLVERVIQREVVESSQVRCELSAGLGVLGEPELLSRALGNLLRNALGHAGGCGPILISSTSSEEEVRVSVIDRGPGVPPEALGRLGEPFFRPDLARSRETGGTGLGLAIVKTCVEACRGRLELRNGESGGLIATLVLKSANLPTES